MCQKAIINIPFLLFLNSVFHSLFIKVSLYTIRFKNNRLTSVHIWRLLTFVFSSPAGSPIDAHPPHPAVSDAARQPDAQRNQAPRTHTVAPHKLYTSPASHTRPAVQWSEERGPAPKAGRPPKRRLVHLVVLLDGTKTHQKVAVQPLHHLSEQQEEQEQLQEQQLPDSHRGAGWWDMELGGRRWGGGSQIFMSGRSGHQLITSSFPFLHSHKSLFHALWLMAKERASA